jgi:hypothetical protein
MDRLQDGREVAHDLLRHLLGILLGLRSGDARLEAAHHLVAHMPLLPPAMPFMAGNSCGWRSRQGVGASELPVVRACFWAE